jgi:hypothetical protein
MLAAYIRNLETWLSKFPGVKIARSRARSAAERQTAPG